MPNMTLPVLSPPCVPCVNPAPYPWPPGTWAMADQGNGAATRGLIDDTSSADDQLTFQAALRALKAARADLSSADAKVASAARRRLACVVAYILGVLDAQGVAFRDGAGPTLDSILGTDDPKDLASGADDLIQAISDGLAAAATRLPSVNWKHLIGAVCVALGGAAFAAL